MEKENLSDIQLHSAGATVRHKSPFENLQSYVNESEITQEFREKWVIPFYFELNSQSAEWIQKMTQLKSSINEKVVLQNLGDFDWRTRSTGSYFASIKQFDHLEDIIGTHLLKSEVCYAGSQYAKSIAIFNSNKSADYLNRYLEYYLTKPELYFDQEAALTALNYLDDINGTNNINSHLDTWKSYLEWRHQNTIRTFENMKKMVPEKADEFDKEIQELVPPEMKLNKEQFQKSIASINKIIEA